MSSGGYPEACVVPTLSGQAFMRGVIRKAQSSIVRKKIEVKTLLRVVDANYNRIKEALRVCEDICRFVINDAKATNGFKKIRHAVTDSLSSFKIKNLIQCRDIEGDVGRSTPRTELKRTDTSAIFYANIQRGKESLRVLEEFMKLISPKGSKKLKNLRYDLYALEKKIASKL